jgi:drug/metabolite transporter (DMT)-like permease
MMFSFFWALQIFVVKLGTNAGVQILPFQVLSLLAATLVLAVLTLPKYGVEFSNFFKQRTRLFWQLFLINGIQAGLGTSLSIIGISLTEAINAGFLVKLAMVTTILFAWVILNERLTVYKILTASSMLFGAYLLTTKGTALLPRIGDIFILGACVCWSLGNVLVRKVLKTQIIRVEVVTFQKPIAGLPVMLVLAGISTRYPGIFGNLQPTFSCCRPHVMTFAFSLLNGFFLAITWTYLNRTLKVATASYMTMMSMVTPVLVSLLAMIFLGETLTLVQFAGASIIILSGLFTGKSQNSPATSWG